MAKYREYMKNQLTELLTEFGQIDELFMDYTYAEGENGKNSKDWDAEGIVKLARKLQPQIIINNRLGLTENRQDWDYITPEQFMATTVAHSKQPTSSLGNLSNILRFMGLPS